MALTEKTTIDRMEILADGQIQVRKARIIYDDGKEITRTYHRCVLSPHAQDRNEVIEDARLDAVKAAVWK
jgi:hypothetical protein